VSAYSERIARVEVEVQELKEAFKAHKEETNTNFKEMNKKLDDLLALRNKGAGVFWLVSSLVGAGILGGAVQFFKWLAGAH
jgi:hypothetical protein